jgi:hypothetical protein
MKHQFKDILTCMNNKQFLDIQNLMTPLNNIMN